MKAPPRITQAGLRIGLFGGTFDPVHAGHIQITRAALQRLALDRIWCLVAPNNPLKGCTPSALETRISASARAMAHPRVDVLGPDQLPETCFTLETIVALRQHFPAHRFVWLMGGDNLLRLHHWRGWRQIVESIPIGIFARPGVQSAACHAPAPKAYRLAQRRAAFAPTLALAKAPAWCYINMPLCKTSSTDLRAAEALYKKMPRPALEKPLIFC